MCVLHLVCKNHFWLGSLPFGEEGLNEIEKLMICFAWGQLASGWEPDVWFFWEVHFLCSGGG